MDVEIDPLTGNVIRNNAGRVKSQPKRRDPSGKKSVVFRNHYYNESIVLYWVNPDNQELFHIADIEMGTDATIDTYETHTFVAKGMESGIVMYPPMISIHEEDVYTFAPQLLDGQSGQLEKPFIRSLNKRSMSASAKFRCLVPGPVDVYYEDGRGGTYQGSLDEGKEYTVNAYEGHVFFFTEKGKKDKILARHTVSQDKVLYPVFDPNRPAAQHLLDHLNKEEAFMKEYLERTGIQWRHYFGPNGPRPPPTLHMWPAEHKGQVHSVVSNDNHWFCIGKSQDCQLQTPRTLTLEVISTKPKAFIIKDFLSEFEALSLLNTGKHLVRESSVGNADAGGARKSETRTSKNAWLGRASNDITETLYRRAEALLNVSHLDRHNTEDMQLVHYVHGQRYDAHHDWGVSGRPESRFITLLLYLTDMASPDSGGETAFPKANDGQGLKIHPGKGSAVLFYNLLEDGNGDDLSLHAALPIHKGEKWLANFWVWDPQRY
jgi:prolyl 4-hydroxylase